MVNNASNFLCIRECYYLNSVYVIPIHCLSYVHTECTRSVGNITSAVFIVAECAQESLANEAYAKNIFLALVSLDIVRING